MKKIIILLLLAITSGCATSTVHQYCQSHTKEYLDYDQCYAEESSNRERRRAWGMENLKPKPSQDVTYRQIGDTTYGSDGSKYRRVGNTIYGTK